MVSEVYIKEIYLGTTLIGRGTSVIGGKEARLKRPRDTGELREKNDVVVKTCWPEESRTSEIEILKKAKGYGKKIGLIGNHVLEVICYLI